MPVKPNQQLYFKTSTQVDGKKITQMNSLALRIRHYNATSTKHLSPCHYMLLPFGYHTQQYDNILNDDDSVETTDIFSDDEDDDDSDNSLSISDEEL